MSKRLTRERLAAIRRIACLPGIPPGGESGWCRAIEDLIEEVEASWSERDEAHAALDDLWECVACGGSWSYEQDTPSHYEGHDYCDQCSANIYERLLEALAREAALREALEEIAQEYNVSLSRLSRGEEPQIPTWGSRVAREALAAPSPGADILERVRAEEREACARVVEQSARVGEGLRGGWQCRMDCAAAIRARGEVGS